jgi:hypothetical protein
MAPFHPVKDPFAGLTYLVDPEKALSSICQLSVEGTLRL